MRDLIAQGTGRGIWSFSALSCWCESNVGQQLEAFELLSNDSSVVLEICLAACTLIPKFIAHNISEHKIPLSWYLQIMG